MGGALLCIKVGGDAAEGVVEGKMSPRHDQCECCGSSAHSDSVKNTNTD